MKSLEERGLKLAPTPAAWIDAVFGDFDAFLQDHASCEKKASGMALSIASHYPDRPDLLSAMADLAVEELGHYREVVRILINRGVPPGPDRKDPYIRALNDLIRRGPDHFLEDRLLIAAIVERRGSERFGLIATALTDTPDRAGSNGEKLAAFYRAITASEERHWQTFTDLALSQCPRADLEGRLTELIDQEAELMLAQPLLAALH